MTDRTVKLRRKSGLRLLEIIMVLVSIVYIYPIFFLLETSFKSPADLYDSLKFPTTLYMGNFTKVFEQSELLHSFGNTLYICALTLLLNILISSMAGYIIGRYKQRFFQYVFYVFLSGLIIPIQTSMVPLFKLGQTLHLSNTLTYLVLIYVAGGIPYATMLYVGFVKSIPSELEEAASIDGAGRFRIFWNIIFPLLLPATGTILVTTIFWYWNDFYSPLLYLDFSKKQTLMTLIFKFKVEKTSTDVGPIYALCLLATIPLIALFLFTQKYLIRGFMAGAVKG